MKYEINIKLIIEDLHDLNLHMPLIKQQIKYSIENNPSNPKSNLRHEGMGTSHDITIEATNED